MSSKHIKEIIIRNILAVFYQKSSTNLILGLCLHYEDKIGVVSETFI